MGLRQKIKDFRERRAVKHEIEGIGEINFYPNRMSLLAEVRDLSEPVARALNVLFADQRQDQGATTKRFEEEGVTVEEIDVQPPPIELIEKRQRDREHAIQDLFAVVADPMNRILIGKLLMDSMRDEFPYAADRHAKDVEEFLNGQEQDGSDAIDLPLLVG